MRSTEFVRYAVGWGVGLWLIGYVLGLVLFAVLPTSIIGWVIAPIGVLITLWVLLTRVKLDSMRSFAILSIVWTCIAVAFDYLFIVKAFNPSDGYYKPDVFLYYVLTFVLPLIVGYANGPLKGWRRAPAAPAAKTRNTRPKVA
jgi:hypothetical protein